MNENEIVKKQNLINIKLHINSSGSGERKIAPIGFPNVIVYVFIYEQF